MKTLNKTLCLVLALVMVLGLFGVASAVEFTDAADIQYKEAVDVMTGIGAINGMGDGTFAPKGNVTRAQAAKMVVYAILGADIAKTLTAETSSFNDVAADNWASPSIEYLVSKGVVNGRGNGIFDPAGNVTSYEIAKMMLCAAGYGAQGEYTGENWQLNVAIDAAKYKIFDGTKETKLDDAATREEATLYAYNGITVVDTVAFNKLTGKYDDVQNEETIAKNVYNYTGIAGATDHQIFQVSKVEKDDVKTSKTYGKLLAYASNGTLNLTFVTETYEVVGHMFKLYQADGKVIFAQQLTTEATPILKADGTTIDATAMAKAYTVAATYDTWLTYDKQAEKSALIAAATMIVMPAVTGDPDGLPNIVAQKAVVATIEKLTITKNIKNQIKVVDGETIYVDETATTPVNNVTTTVDWTKYITDGTGYFQVVAFDDVFAVYETSTVIGVPTKLTGTTYTVDGKDIKATAIISKDTTGITTEVPTLQSATATNPTKYTFYLDAQGNYFAIAADSTAAPEGNAYLITYKWSEAGAFNALTYKALGIGADGKVTTFTTDNTSFGNLPANAEADAFKKVTVNETTGLATFDVVDAEYNAATTTVDNEIEKTDVTLETKKYINSSTVFVFVPADGAPTYTNAAASDKKEIVVKTGVSEVAGQIIPAGSMMYYAKTTEDNKTVSVVVVNATFNTNLAETNKSLIFVPTATASTSSVSGAKYFPVYIDGAKDTILVSDTDVTNIDAQKLKAGFYTYTTTSGVVTLTKVTGTAVAGKSLFERGAIVNIYETLVTVAGNPTNASSIASSIQVNNKSVLTTKVCDTRTEPETAITSVIELGQYVKAQKELGAPVWVAVVVDNDSASATFGQPLVAYVLDAPAP